MHLTSNSDPVKLQAVYKLVEEAVEDTIANDAVTRNTLAKVRNTLWKATGTDPDFSHSRATSRAPSVAPSVAGDEEDDRTVLDGEGDDKSIVEPVATSETEEQNSTTATPAASPQKKTQSRLSAAVPRKKKQVAELISESEEKENTKPTYSKPRPIVAVMIQQDQNPPAPTQQRGRKKPIVPPPESSPKQSSILEADDESTLRATAPPLIQNDSVPSSPSMPIAASPERAIKSEPLDGDGDVDMMDVDTIELAPPPRVTQPVKKPRGRPPKNANVSTVIPETQEQALPPVRAPMTSASKESVTTKPVRKSVRANRRETASSMASLSEM